MLFVHGLSPNTSLYVRSKHPQTLEEAIREATTYDNVMAIGKTNNIKYIPFLETTSTVALNALQTRQQQRYPTFNSATTKDDCFKFGLCFYCKKSGHRAVKYRKRPQEQQHSTAPYNHAQSYPPLDYSFHNAEKLEDAVAEPRVASGGPKLIKESDRYHSYGINLNHNMLNGPLDSLADFIRTKLVDPNALSSLDLSFNEFTEIPAVITQFPALKYFYFHKNMLSDIAEVQKLVSLKGLKYLTLHGNPIEITVPYSRSYVLCLLPGLRSLNCTPVTKGDRKISEVWAGMNKNLLPKYLNKTSKI